MNKSTKPSLIAFIFIGAFLSGNKLCAEDLKKAPFTPGLLVVPKTTVKGIHAGGVDNFFWDKGPTPRPEMALSTFNFEFLNGDHKIHNIGILAFDGLGFGSLGDANGGDQFDLLATYYDVEGAKAAFHNLVDYGYHPSEKVALAGAMKSGFTYAINGFQFARQFSDDCSIESIFIYIDAQKDLSSGFKGSCKPDNKLVTFSAIPNNAIASIGTISGTGPMAEKIFGTMANYKKVVIRGFNIRFDNGAHFVKKFGIDLQPWAKKNVILEDNDGNDPISWDIDYAILK